MVFPGLWQCISVAQNARILVTLKKYTDSLPPPQFCPLLPSFVNFLHFGISGRFLLLLPTSDRF